jgi:undecaprenyl-diphosphatase
MPPGADPFLLDLVKAVLLGVVEGLTEFLPVSSTGHLILAGGALDFHGPLAVTFEIFIQLGAVLAVVWLFRADLGGRLRRAPTSAHERRFLAGVLAAVVPAALVGVLAADWIRLHLFAPLPVALAQIAGALALLASEASAVRARTHSLDDIEGRQELAVGLAQIASLWPGFSRAGATIIGGEAAGLDRPTATRFSFYVAIPTVTGASLYALARHAEPVGGAEWLLLGAGFAASFLTALLTVRWFLGFVQRHSLAVFAWYRLALGALVLLWLALG